MFRIIFFLLIVIPTSAFALSFDGKFIQGHFIIGKTQPETEIWIDKKQVRVTKDGYFVFGIGRDRKYDIVIKSIQNGKTKKIVKKVKKRKYRIQRIDGLPEKKVTPPKEFYGRIKRENNTKRYRCENEHKYKNQICYKNKIQIFFFGHFLKLFEYAVIIPIKAIENKVIIITIATTAALGHCCPDFVVSKIKIGNVGS